MKCPWSKRSSEDYEVNCHKKVAKVTMCYRPGNTHFTKELIFNTYYINMKSQKYDGRISSNIA